MNNSQDNRNISRRNFLGLARGAAGIAALASMGVSASWAANNLNLTSIILNNRIVKRMCL